MTKLLYTDSAHVSIRIIHNCKDTTSAAIHVGVEMSSLVFWTTTEASMLFLARVLLRIEEH